MVGLFHYGYSPFSLVAGVAMDQLGPRKVIIVLTLFLKETGPPARTVSAPIPIAHREAT